MSDENKPVAGGNDSEVSKPKEDSSKFVSAKAYEEVSKDMHRFKSRTKELEAAHNELIAQLKAQEEAKLIEQNKWEEIAKSREAELEAERKRAMDKEQRFNRSIKMGALKSELGGSIKDTYLVHADLDGISLNEDGTIDSESLLDVANKFRQEHGQLITPTNNVNITGQAASTLEGFPQKRVEEMTHEEKVRALQELQQNKQ